MAPRLLTFFVFCALTLFLAHREDSRGHGKMFETHHFGWLHANDHIEHRISEVLLVSLDDGDAPEAERIFQSWPLSELDYALLLDNLFQNKPRAVAIEPVLSWPEEGAPFLENLASRLQNAPPLLLSTIGEFSEFAGSENAPGADDSSAETESPLKSLTKRHVVLKNTSGDISRLPQITAFLSAPARQVAGEAPLAVTHIDLGDNIETPGDGTLRVPLLARVGEDVVAAFPLAALLLHRGVETDAVSVQLGHRITAPGLEVAIDAAGRYTLDLDALQLLPVVNARLFALSLSFSGSPDIESGNEKTADSVIAGLIESDADYGKLALLESHLVVLGQNDRGAHRYSTGAGDASLSRAEVFCQTVAAMDIGEQLIKAPDWADYAIGGAALVLVCTLLQFCRATVLKTTFLLLLLLAMASLLAFQQWHFWFPVFSALVVLLCGAVAALLIPLQTPKADRPTPPY